MTAEIIRAITFKWTFYFVGWLGILALVVEKCPAKDWPGIKAYLKSNVSLWLKALLFYTGAYVLWANAEALVGSWPPAQPFLFLLHYKAACGSFFLAYWVVSLVRTAEKKMKEKGMVVENGNGTP